jgi:hypothetical protein
MCHVVLAQPADIPAWLDLARQVEPLFEQMVDDPAFHRALHKNIARGTAFCIREADEPAPDGPEGGSRQIFRRSIC